MGFIVSHNGKIYEGPRQEQRRHRRRKMTSFDPGPGGRKWRPERCLNPPHQRETPRRSGS
jgi:hypothetical protein